MDKFSIEEERIQDSTLSYHYFNKTPRLLGCEPDLYYEDSNGKLLVLGEAKTSKDSETTHSINQYGKCLEHCSRSPSKSYFIVAIPERSKARINNLFRNKFAKMYANVHIEILGIPEVDLAEY